VSHGYLVEREVQAKSLLDAISTTSSSGTVVLLSGEAGHGKTSLVKEVVGALDHKYRTLWAACEPVGIPTAFGALYDIVNDLPSEVAEAVHSRSGVAPVGAGLLDLLKNDRVVLIFEDIHWADEATLGLVRYLGRRIEATSSCLILTFRSEQLDLVPPLRLVVADLGSQAVRIDVPPLSLAGVAELAVGKDVDPLSLHATTMGNPFFVDEILNDPGTVVPPNVQNAVLANADDLSLESSELVGLIALSSEGLRMDLLATITPNAEELLELPLRKRLITWDRGTITCRHELIRESLLRAMSDVAIRRRHARLLSALEGSADGAHAIARLAYHSVGAGDAEKAFAYSKLAGDNAARGGAHRQASLHYVDALEADDYSDLARRSEVLLAAAIEDMTVNNNDRACEFAAERVELAADPVDAARAQAWLSYIQSRINDLDSVRSAASNAIEVLADLAPCKELAIALSSLAWVERVEGKSVEALDLAERAEEIARLTDAKDFEVKASLVAARLLDDMGDQRGRERLEAAADEAVAANLGEFGANATYALGCLWLNRFDLAPAVASFGRAAEYASGKELDAWYIASIATRATTNVWAGNWDDADRDLEIVLRQKTCIETEIEILVAAATLRLRRGDPGTADLINSVLQLALDSSDREILETTCGLALEAAWVGVLPMESAVKLYDEVVAGQTILSVVKKNFLTFWANRLGLAPPDGELVGPSRLEHEGDWKDAADAWQKAGFAIEPIITMAMSPGEDLHQLVGELLAMGAEGTVDGLRRELQHRGFRNVPKGIRPSTRKNGGRLTNRECEVLVLVANGMSNSAIADELFISEKTVGHHVSAILAKANASNRTEAVAVASASGWLEEVVVRN